LTRSDTVGCCAEQGISPRIDASNEDLAYYRNRLRHELLPVLETYNPQIRKVLVRTAAVTAAEMEFMQDSLDRSWAEMEITAPAGELQLDLTRWRALPLALQRLSVREAVRRLRGNARDLELRHVELAVHTAREGSTGSQAVLPGGLVLEVGYQAVRFASLGMPWPVDSPQVESPVSLPIPGTVALGNGWSVRISEFAPPLSPGARPEDPWEAWLDADAVGAELWLRPRAAGDRFRPFGMEGRSVSVKEYMIDRKVPRSVRHAWPLLVARWGLVWVCGLRVDDRAVATEASRGIWCVRFLRD
jgi:tRNA(Ile)-lysidine synthase